MSETFPIFDEEVKLYLEEWRGKWFARGRYAKREVGKNGVASVSGLLNSAFCESDKQDAPFVVGNPIAEKGEDYLSELENEESIPFELYLFPNELAIEQHARIILSARKVDAVECEKILKDVYGRQFKGALYDRGKKILIPADVLDLRPSIKSVKVVGMKLFEDYRTGTIRVTLGVMPE